MAKRKPSFPRERDPPLPFPRERDPPLPFPRERDPPLRAVVEFDAFEQFVEPFVFAAVAGEFLVVRRVHVRAAGGE